MPRVLRGLEHLYTADQLPEYVNPKAHRSAPVVESTCGKRNGSPIGGTRLSMMNVPYALLFRPYHPPRNARHAPRLPNAYRVCKRHYDYGLRLILAVAWVPLSDILDSTMQTSAQPVALHEILSIEEFFSITDVRVADDGSIYVADNNSFTVSKYDSQGRLVRRVGTQGMAPGEFAGGPDHLALVDGDLIGSDNGPANTMHYFDSDLNYKGSSQVASPLDMDIGPNGVLYFGAIDVTTLTRIIHQ